MGAWASDERPTGNLRVVETVMKPPATEAAMRGVMSPPVSQPLAIASHPPHAMFVTSPPSIAPRRSLVMMMQPNIGKYVALAAAIVTFAAVGAYFEWVNPIARAAPSVAATPAAR